MKNKFYIHSHSGYGAMAEQYKAMYEQIGSPRFLPNHKACQETVYDIKPEYGRGTIQIFKLLGNLMLLVYDFVFSHDVITAFDLSEEYFEIEYCMDGCMYIEEENAGGTCFSPNYLSLSLSHDMKGTVKRCGGQKYQGVSITAGRDSLSAYFGSTGISMWNDTVERLEESLRSQYYLGQYASPEIAAIFRQIYNCRLPVRSRTLFYESKVMEALSLIVSHEVAKQENYRLISLSQYELQRIREIPQMLLDQPFELPSLLTLSRHLGLNPKKLAKGFKLVYGDTVFSYYRKLSLKCAASLLLETDSSVNEIAYDSGYSSPSNFCAAFKKQYGLTPLKYREASLLRSAE